MDPLFVETANFRRGCEITECVDKVEAMLSTAILHQEDLWNILVVNAPEDLFFDLKSGEMSIVAEIDPEVFKAIKSKLETSMDWCQLAQSRLKRLLNSQAQ